MRQSTGYHINVAKMAPDRMRSQWDMEHGTGFKHVFNIELGEITLDEAMSKLRLITERFPVSEGYNHSLLYIPGETREVESTHMMHKGQVRIKTWVQGNPLRDGVYDDAD